MAKYSKVEDPSVLELLPKILKKFPDKFSHIKQDDIVLIFKESDDSKWFGQTRLIKGIWKVITDKCILISLWKNAWDAKPESWRALLIYHELLHIGVNDDRDYQLIKHDIEDFAEVIKKYGLDWENSDGFFEELNSRNLE